MRSRGLFLALAMVAPAAAQQPDSTPVFAVAVERIRVEVLVTRGGRPVRGLRAADFEVRDSGVLQQLEPALEVGAPVDTVLVLDLSGSVAGPKLNALREATAAYLDQVRPGERAALLGFASRVALLQPFTDELKHLRLAVERAATGGSTSLYDAVYAALRLGDEGARRTPVVVFSDGLDNASWLRIEQLLQAARRSDAVVYGVLAGEGQERDQSALRDLAKATGGRVFEARKPGDLRARFLEVLDDIRSRYVLSFAPSGVEAAGWHPLTVRLRREADSVLARPGYWRPPAPP